MASRYRTYSGWLRSKFGTTVYKVPVDGGFTCPNRDGKVGWGGCSYCNNESFRSAGTSPAKSVPKQIADGVAFLTRRYAARRFLVYWQHYTNTYAPVERLENLYRQALEADSRIVGMTVGTRPDCLEEEKLELLADLARRSYVSVELGLESFDDRTLERVGRGHDVACFLEAVDRVRSRGIDVCVHLVCGFPDESRERMLGYADRLNHLDIRFVKLHHLHVVRGTRLAKEYSVRPFPLFSAREWAEFTAEFLESLHPRIVLQRLFGWTSRRFLVAPVWPYSRAELHRLIEEVLEERDAWQGKRLGYELNRSAEGFSLEGDDGYL
ncbi:MAG TPA: TIGR01212 family radical SAM protein [Acidobacteriota bacterium]|mgnify:FL=1|nr:TIGR01212 family radical SAM protein [Acidobacteriota bacterium]